ncbi:hypothetical protein BCR42DRAFT_395158 [Absidia repens]|uniref:Subtilisin inhibitor domain-containing protein n=1 Tax=Absidia repens TaxID=90262 RepID=A0A1X2I8B2_9FUNG|nr:hypothetical protein BCR42DRAFT_395158 [Absidia repens]
MMVFFKSTVCVSMLLMLLMSSSAPTTTLESLLLNMDKIAPGEPHPPEIVFDITETYHDKTDTKQLRCGNKTAGGTHPHPREACDEFISILTGTNPMPPEDCVCTDQYDPVTVSITIQLPNHSEPYPSTVTFPNVCLFHCRTRPLRQFLDIGVVPPDNPTKQN